MPKNPEIKPRHGALHRRANTALVIKLLAAGTTYGFSVLAARTLGADGFGQVAVFLSAALFLSVVGAAGQQTAGLRFIPPLLGSQHHRAAAFVGWAFRRASRATLVLYLATLCFGLTVAHFGWLTGYSPFALVLGLSLIPLVGLMDFQSHVARGYHLLPLSMIPKEIIWRGLAGLAILILFQRQGGAALRPETVLAVLLISLGLVTLGQGIVLRRQTRIRFRKPTDDDIPTQWKAAAVPFWISSVSNVFLANADTVTVGLLVGPKAAGFYFAANRLAMLLAFFQTSHNVVLGPMLAASWQADGPEATARMLRDAAFRMTIPTLLLGVILGALAPQALSLFGTDFAQAATPLRLLILAGVINAALGPGDIALNMCGFHRTAMGASAAMLLVSAPLLVIGAILGGATGVAFAVLLATVLRKAVFWFLTLRHMSIRSDALARWSDRAPHTKALHP